MRIEVDFDDLWKEVKRITIKRSDFSVSLRSGDIDPIDLELNEGKEVDIEDIGNIGGLLVHKDRQVLLYIRDHSGRVASTVADPWGGNRFHVSHCQKLDQMRRENRFQRYVATNNMSGVFHVVDENGYGWPSEGHAALKVCQYCVSGLNYKNARSSHEQRRRVAAEFLLSEFFSTYSSCFVALPQRWDSAPADKYTDDWESISRHVRETRDFCCEQCGVRLVNDPRLCHVHHIDGLKANNAETNLQVLCIACHRERPGHRGVFVRRGEMLRITQLRKIQGVAHRSGWDVIFRECDPAIHGALSLVSGRVRAIPELGVDLLDASGVVVDCAEAAWPDFRVGLSVKPSASASSWTVWTFDQVVAAPEKFIRLLTG